MVSVRPDYFIFMGYLRKIDKISKANPHTFIHTNSFSRNPGSAPVTCLSRCCVEPYLVAIPKSGCTSCTCILAITPMGDLRLNGSILRKSRFIFKNERRTIWQKSGCLNHSIERIFQVNILMQGRVKDSWKEGSFSCWFLFVGFISFILNIL